MSTSCFHKFTRVIHGPFGVRSKVCCRCGMSEAWSIARRRFIPETQSEMVKLRETVRQQRDLIKELAGALDYTIMVREIECAHKHPAPDDCCAKCVSDTALTAYKAWKAGV